MGKKIKRTFNKEFMLDILYESENIISDEIYDKTRWSIVHKLIFKHEDKFYRATYSVGATEMQDESRPWEYEDNIQCIEVKPIEKMIVVYEPVKEEE